MSRRKSKSDQIVAHKGRSLIGFICCATFGVFMACIDILFAENAIEIARELAQLPTVIGLIDTASLFGWFAAPFACAAGAYAFLGRDPIDGASRLCDALIQRVAGSHAESAD